MYDILNKIVCDGIEYYYNTGEYVFVFDPPEGGRIWIGKITESDIENCSEIPYELLDEFIRFATYVKNLEK